MRFLPMIALSMVLAACAGSAPAPAVRLSDLRPLPARADPGITPLRVAVAAVISPKGTIESYQPLLDYLAGALGRPVELVQRRTYAEVNDLIEAGAVDVGFVCTSAYVEGHDTFGMELLAAPVVNGAPVYYSVLVVPAASPATSMADLRGKVFAFTDPMSTSGRMYPASLVADLGARPEQFFGRTFFTYGHDDAIRAVAGGVADGAAVDSLVYDFAIARDPVMARKIKVIHRSPAMGIPPVVVGPRVSPQLRARLQEALLAMGESGGESALSAIGVERFVPIDDHVYASVRTLIARMAPQLR
jgi:phosphonate transport system substrate-binding protein